MNFEMKKVGTLTVKEIDLKFLIRTPTHNRHRCDVTAKIP